VLEAVAALELAGLFALAKHLEASQVFQLFTGFDGAAELGDAAGEVGVLGQEGLAYMLGLLQSGDLGATWRRRATRSWALGSPTALQVCMAASKRAPTSFSSRCALWLAHRPRLSSSATSCARW
jgi:hypothetical protein